MFTLILKTFSTFDVFVCMHFIDMGLDFAEIEVYWRGKKTRMLECFLGAL
jgi:hypothetical protein